MNDLDRMRLFFDLNGIRRYNFVEGGYRVLQSQTVAAHTAGVAFYALVIANTFGLRSLAQQWAILVRALMHDLGEIYTGDLPYVVLKENPDLDKLIKQVSSRRLREDFHDFPQQCLIELDADCLENTIIKLADKLDVYFFFQKELALGNQTVRQFLPRLTGTLRGLFSKALEQGGDQVRNYVGTRQVSEVLSSWLENL